MCATARIVPDSSGMISEDQVGTPLERRAPTWALIGCALLGAVVVIGGIVLLIFAF